MVRLGGRRWSDSGSAPLFVSGASNHESSSDRGKSAVTPVAGCNGNSFRPPIRRLTDDEWTRTKETSVSAPTGTNPVGPSSETREQ